MLFSSPAFFLLLALTFSAFWIAPWQRLRLAILAVASAVFYGWSDPPALILLAFTISLNYVFGRALERRRSKRLLAAAIALNLTPLLWFKYEAFILRELNVLFGALGFPGSLSAPAQWLPLGISFFTFQVIAYQVDVYRGEVAAERSPLVFAVFKSFFAQLIAGPIVRAHAFLPELRTRAVFDPERTHRGLFILLCGLGIKLGVADVLAQFADAAFLRGDRQTTSEAWLGLYAYALQLFADFWGYSSMAVGVGLLFGFHLPVNFQTPYRAESLQDFWRRWHITLSSWFRDYLYIPLGGNRRHATRNLLITMGLAGLWHGAGWTFVLWGLAHGAWLALERAAKRAAKRDRGAFREKGPGKLSRGIRPVLRHVLVFQGVCLCWVLFRAPDVDAALAYYARLLLPPYTFNPTVPEVLAAWLVGFYALHPMIARLFDADTLARTSLRRQVATVAILGYLALAYGGATYDFIYFRF
ncbi:MAG: MBOAT family protein [Deltaproteobacteria bacterium]|nr:MBOAT family protein [Deltaproteobacteria bacterium]